MTLLRMLAFRPETTAQAGAPAQAGVAARTAPPGAQARAAAVPAAAATAAVPAPATPAAVIAPPASAAGVPVAGAPPIEVDARTWPAVVEAANLSGMVRQFALNCVPASFENDVLSLRLDQAVAERRARPIEDKLVQGLSQYLGRDIRVIFDVSDAALATPARQRALAEQDRVSRAAAAFEQDPAVKGLRERFGAEVDAASVKPTN
jgi:hypothetical protein